ncbi:type II toxin-antitoxin system RelE/ParE family toxin [Candidatus Dependentiae bacterium]|jgi:hypothetical protein|nr:type II toxin-antitoxin system RelE/ParE family toxin [Candidatus Dependentiae bacterium]
MKKIKIIETRYYLSQLSKIIHKGQNEETLRNEIRELISQDPSEGDLIPGTGGLRKIRYPIPGKGKSGGCRIIYYFYNEKNPVSLLTIYAKNRADDLSPQEKKAFSKIAQELKAIYK